MHTTTALFALSALLSPLYALTIISPFPGTNIDPTQPIKIIWTSSSSDPATIELKIDNSSPNSLSTDEILASGVSTSSGSFTVPADTIQNFGTGYQIQALGSGGNVLAQAGSLTLGAGSNSVSTASNGQISFVSTATVSQASETTNAGATTTAAPAGTTGATSSLDSAAATGGTTILSGTVTAESTTKSSGFVTSSTTKSGASASEASAAATSAANTNTANSLGRMRSGGEVVMGAAGVLAGIVALIV